MKLWLWYVIAFKREIQKGKLRPILRFLLDREYRASINRLARLLTRYPRLLTRFETMPLRDIYFSHEVNYPEWVKVLVARMISGTIPPPIAVIHDGTRYVVADGNHRLLAMIMALPPETPVVVRVLYPDEERAA
jgi:hypothetical protein